MADWKQITARIRRARSGKDPLGQLANLYEKTSDAMVAFELAKLFENSGQNSDAAKWYSTAAARFRRAEWKSKAEEAAVRLGASPREATTEGVLDSEEPSHSAPSSRLSWLEMQFRRLLACPPAKLSDADRAPAGPGVSVLTDSDLTTYYYVEVCQTLRIAVGTLLRGGHRRGTDSIKPGLAEHLGIPEARVAKYLADHCVVRWLQLDEGASNLAHFAIAVLRPILNE